MSKPKLKDKFKRIYKLIDRLYLDLTELEEIKKEIEEIKNKIL